MFETIITVAGLLGCSGIIAGAVNRKIDRIGKKIDKQSELRVKESELMFQGLQAVGHLGESTALALKNGHTNGETETALKYYYGFRDDCNAFTRRQTAESVHRD